MTDRLVVPTTEYCVKAAFIPAYKAQSNTPQRLCATLWVCITLLE